MDWAESKAKAIMDDLRDVSPKYGADAWIDAIADALRNTRNEALEDAAITIDGADRNDADEADIVRSMKEVA